MSRTAVSSAMSLWGGGALLSRPGVTTHRALASSPPVLTPLSFTDKHHRRLGWLGLGAFKDMRTAYVPGAVDE